MWALLAILVLVSGCASGPITPDLILVAPTSLNERWRVATRDYTQAMDEAAARVDSISSTGRATILANSSRARSALERAARSLQKDDFTSAKIYLDVAETATSTIREAK